MEHVPVLPHESVELLHLFPGLVVVDGTIGPGGHAQLFLHHILPGGLLIGLDRDEAALDLARQRLQTAAPAVELLQTSFADLRTVLQRLRLPTVDRIFLDLGPSAHQLTSPRFSFAVEGPLDCRYDPSTGLPASEVINTWAESALADLFFRYGEERYARRIARGVVRQRAQTPITTTTQLAQVVVRSLPRGVPWGRRHPATRVFMALRIYVNQELEALERILEEAFDLLASGGRLVVISYHSLEDRLVKQALRRASRPASRPSETGDGSTRIHLLTPKPLTPTAAERRANPRARSAKLRAAEKWVLTTHRTSPEPPPPK